MHHPADSDARPGRSASGRHVAPGGWRRSLVGVLVGAVAAALALATMRSSEDPVLPPEPGELDDPQSGPGA